LFFLAGCATVPAPAPLGDPAVAWETRRHTLAPITAWEIHGRLAMHTREEGWQARLRWVRRCEQHRIDLTGPLGRGHLRLTQDNDGATLSDAQHVYRDSNAEQLLARATGWYVPFEGLGYWVRGLPAPDGPSRQDLDGHGRLRSLQQHDWDIRYLEYTRVGGHELPSKLFLKRVLQSGGTARSPEDRTLEVRLVIERWEVKSDEDLARAGEAESVPACRRPAR
jgi:outer membrane lipoprotein LolB